MTTLSELWIKNRIVSTDADYFVTGEYLTKERFIELCQSPDFRDAIVGECEYYDVLSDAGDRVRCCDGEFIFYYGKGRGYCQGCGRKIKEVK